MTTFHEVIERTRRRLMTTQREPITTLSAAVTAGDTTWNLASSTRFGENARLSCDLEDVYVTGTASGTATVVPGQYGSTEAAHDSGATVHIDPTWSNWDIAQAVNDELADLSSPGNGLFRIRSVDFDYNPTQLGYELTGLSDFQDVWKVRYNQPGPEDDWPIIPRGLWRVDQAADTTDFASGVQIVLKTGGYPGHKVRVSYRATYDTLTAVTDDVETTSGLHAQAHDILSLGAAIRLLSGLGAQRAYTTGQPDPRRLDETSDRAAANAIVPLVEQHERRVRAEAARLARRYPQAIS